MSSFIVNRNENFETELVMLAGISGCGKSTYANKKRENGYAVFSSDALRKELYGDEKIQGNPSDIFRKLTERSKEALKSGQSCVVDATNLSRKRRRNFLMNFKRIRCFKRCVLFVVPVEECLKRNRQRGRNVDEEVIQKMIKSFQCPYPYEGWDRIDIQHEEAWDYEYPFEVIEDFPQDNIHHTLTLGGHIKKAEEYCREHGFSQPVQLAARYHDCGKLYTKTFFNMKGQKCENAHYYDHENYSTYLFLNEMFSSSKYKNYTIEEILYVANLINWHMEPLKKWNQLTKSKQNDRMMLGEEMYQDIMRLHEADRAAH